jgi:hypothetical protein
VAAGHAVSSGDTMSVLAAGSPAIRARDSGVTVGQAPRRDRCMVDTERML